ncbi:hypothetical protein EG68_11080 [Paragonimus skrjabini miyazakii]|uniref:Uncharacterized protein n=1 Tax=Paragonimus skrjabini miyazakii TaxID=59628 RepID=A0A8S9YBH6_9TREM|nr:hypothetical protein EG68_11080 [Paragonimus skrjabini miyazakii]
MHTFTQCFCWCALVASSILMPLKQSTLLSQASFLQCLSDRSVKRKSSNHIMHC